MMKKRKMMSMEMMIMIKIVMMSNMGTRKADTLLIGSDREHKGAIDIIIICTITDT
jgi:hypothetical protein